MSHVRDGRIRTVRAVINLIVWLFQFGILNKSKDGDKMTRKKDKQKAKEDEKLEKRRQKEEKLKKHAEKEKEREKKKQEKIKQTKGAGGTPISSQSQLPLIEDFAQSETNRIPLFLEKCVRFVEDEGLDSEGIYRVPGNRAHVELLFQKFEEGNIIYSSLAYPDVDISFCCACLREVQ